MPEPEVLTVQVQHRVSRQAGAFSLDVSFEINRWPVVLFGPSGAGKSTLLRIIAGLDRADASRVHLGEQVLGSSGTRGLVQMVTQRPALFPHLNVEQNVAFGLTHLGSAERKARITGMLSLLGAESLQSREIAGLSGGERQRVAIARALAPHPRFLLLDEAFVGLESSTKQDLLGRLTDFLKQHGTASIHVTHEVGDAFALDAEVVLLNGGRVAAQGHAQEALALEREKLLATLGASRAQQWKDGPNQVRS